MHTANHTKIALAALAASVAMAASPAFAWVSVGVASYGYYPAPVYAAPYGYYPAYPQPYPAYAPPGYGQPPAPAGPPPQAQNDDGYCREYQSAINVDGHRQPSYGTACRDPEGHWRIMN